VLKIIFNQMFILDKLKINKEEMHHPVKHVIVSNNKPILLDFERCHKTLKPHNVTQFCQYIIRLSKLLKGKNIIINKKKIIKLSKIYKKDINKKNLRVILNEIQ